MDELVVHQFTKSLGLVLEPGMLDIAGFELVH
jgi:hypothetical protein